VSDSAYKSLTVERSHDSELHDCIDRPNKTLSYEFNRLITPIQLHRRRLNLDAAVIIAFSYIWLPLPNPAVDSIGATRCPVCGRTEIATAPTACMHSAVQLSCGCHLTPFVLARLCTSIFVHRYTLHVSCCFRVNDAGWHAQTIANFRAKKITPAVMAVNENYFCNDVELSPFRPLLGVLIICLLATYSCRAMSSEETVIAPLSIPPIFVLKQLWH